ncbi:MAG TPA: GNAT family N-acetyltransferase [Microlunatus sp.]|nr:GNAT family N-acetyltransferase [Microlunatus sp.]
MTVRTRRVWRVSPGTLAAVWVFVLLAGLGVPTLAVLAWLRSGELLVSVFLLVLAAGAVIYGWRFGVRPRLFASSGGVEVVNPGRRTAIPWEELTVIAPGENGIVLGTEESRTEAWCVQKSKRATRKGRTTRADTVVAELEDMRDEFDPPLEDEQTGIRLRRARQADLDLLTSLERAASEAGLQHIFDPEQHPYPTDLVRRRWRRTLRDRRVHIRVLEEHGAAVGLVAWDTRGQLRHLAVSPRYANHGHGSLLLHYATEELMATGVRELFLWVLEDNLEARGFYRTRGWRDTDERTDSEYPPHPAELKMVRTNPHAPRRRAA